eukprot:scaffold1554_cov401-Prasinococcus_capsulatus_cf.AAC.25
MYFDGNGELDHYIRTMGQNRTWGDELTLRACCDAYGLAIHVIQVSRQVHALPRFPEIACTQLQALWALPPSACPRYGRVREKTGTFSTNPRRNSPRRKYSLYTWPLFTIMP